MATVQAQLSHNKKIYNPTAPFKYTLGCLYPGKMFIISGIPREGARRITVELTDDSGKNIAFSFGIRLDEKVIVRNSMISGGWGNEERYLNVPFPFVPGKFFEIVIFVDQSCFKVSLNDEALVEYKYRVPLENIDQFKISGDIHLTKVAIQG